MSDIAVDRNELAEMNDREAFVAAHQHLDLTETKDAWGRPMYAAPHVNSIWFGWKQGRAALRSASVLPDREETIHAICPHIKQWCDEAEIIPVVCEKCPATVKTSQGEGVQMCRLNAEAAADAILSLFPAQRTDPPERAAELEWNKPYPHSKAGEGRIPEDIARAINELNDYADDLDATERPAIGDYDVAADIRAICQFAVDLAVPASVQEQPVAWRPWFVSDLHSGDRCEVLEGDSFNNRIIARAESPADALKIVEAHNRPAAWQDGYRAGLKRAAKYHDDAARDCEAIAAVNKDNDLGPDCETHAIDHRVAADDLRELALATPSQTAGEREWQPIETAPETAWGCRNSGLVYSSILGVKSAELGNYNGYVHASIAGYHGNAVEDWGVTHWMPLPSSPTGEKQ